MRALFIVLMAAAVSAQSADRPWSEWLGRRVLPPEEAKAALPRFMEEQLKPIPLPETRESWLSRRDALRQEVHRILGIDDVVKPPGGFKAEAKGVIRRDGYRIEKITYETWPGMAMPALVYIPEGVKGPLPAIVSISGHTLTSKAADYVQLRNVNLALRGCVVLSYEYFGYGERKTGDHPHGPVGENGHEIRTFSFSRRTATGIEALEAIRAVDVLVSRPEVDPERIGFTGESGGSNTTYWAAAVDPRVKLAVPVSSVTTFDYWIRKDCNWDWHQRPPGIRRVADIGTLLALHAPHPLVIISSLRGTDDAEFPLHEAEKSYQWAKHVYRLLSAEDAAEHYESTTSHGYQEDKRRKLYSSVERWLKPPAPKGDVELRAKIETLDDLRCGIPEKNLTYRELFAQCVKPLPRPMESSEQARKFLRDRLALPDPLPELKAEKKDGQESGSWVAQYWAFESEPGIRLPGVLIGRKGDTGPVVLVPGRDGEMVTRALEGGKRVFAFDLRGAGELRHGNEGTWPWTIGPPWHGNMGSASKEFSNWAWFAGRPWPGMWALDLLQAARLCREKFSAPSVSVDARVLYGWSALLAGAAAPGQLSASRVELLFESQHEILRARGDRAQADVPGLLEHLDVAHVRALWPEAEVIFRK